MLPLSKQKNEENSWLLTYSDTITLLLCFFVLLLSVSTINQSKVEKISSGLTKTLSRKESVEPFSKIGYILTKSIEKKEGWNDIEIKPTSLGLLIRFPSKLLFNTGSAIIKETINPFLKNIVTAINESQYKNYIINIEGHTDNIPINTPLYESNWELSAHRATNVVKKLIEKGIPAKKLRAIALGSTHPIEKNQNSDGSQNLTNQAKNRRIEVYIQRKFN